MEEVSKFIENSCRFAYQVIVLPRNIDTILAMDANALLKLGGKG